MALKITVGGRLVARSARGGRRRSRQDLVHCKIVFHLISSNFLQEEEDDYEEDDSSSDEDEQDVKKSSRNNHQWHKTSKS